MEPAPNPFQSTDDPPGPLFIDRDRLGAYSPSTGDSLEEHYRRLQAREAALLRRQQQMQEFDSLPPAVAGPNWPPYISFLYVDMSADIPPAARSLIKVALFGVILVICQSAINIVACCSIRGLGTHNYVKSLIFGVIFAIMTTYLTISICFERLYKACKTHDVPFSYVTWQFVLIGWTGYLAVGFPNSGSVGFATFIDLVAKSPSTWSKLIAFVNSLALLISFFTQIIVMRKAQNYQKVSGIPENLQTILNPRDPIVIPDSAVV
jgi:hypothetical protein